MLFFSKVTLSLLRILSVDAQVAQCCFFSKVGLSLASALNHRRRHHSLSSMAIDPCFGAGQGFAC